MINIYQYEMIENNVLKIVTRIFLKRALSFGGSGSLEGIAGNRIPKNCFYTGYYGCSSIYIVDRRRFLYLSTIFIQV